MWLCCKESFWKGLVKSCISRMFHTVNCIQETLSLSGEKKCCTKAVLAPLIWPDYMLVFLINFFVNVYEKA